jgi:hypothetical protein
MTAVGATVSFWRSAGINLRTDLIEELPEEREELKW